MPAPQGTDFKLVIPVLTDGTLVVEGVGEPSVGFDHLSGDQGSFGLVLPEGFSAQIGQYQE